MKVTTSEEAVAYLQTCCFDLEAQVKRLLAGTTVNDVLPRRAAGVITIPADSTVGQAMDILAGNNILSAPIVGVNSHELLGMVDMFDILVDILSFYGQRKNLPLENGEAVSINVWNQDIEQLTAEGETFSRELVSEVINRSDLNPTRLIPASAPLKALLSELSGVHRIVVTDDDRRPMNLISQSDVVKFFARNHNLFTNVLSKKVGDLGIIKADPLRVTMTVKVLHAYHKMNTSSVSAVAVVDDQDRLMANLSVSDLKGIRAANFACLHCSVAEYLINISRTTRIPPISVTPDTSLELVVLKIASAGLHRVWVTDGSRKLVGVISLSDILGLLSQHI